ncbi:cuticle protein AM1199-like [Penaeus japonicus]|uniref:cuticle protein AM1199-like n=1 Tax=Penaeus japonicus TaxID=27405 RepID=UPI001C70D2F9|nr:cuticle protein AM1199-like [Penaeus japonicus]
MKTLLLSMLLAVAVADKPSFSYDAPASRSSAPLRVIEIIRDDRVHPAADGTYTFDVETEDGISRHEAGGVGGSQQGSVNFKFPDGQVFDLQFVADANGYQPQSPFLPVAPAFPHPIPAHALRQIERARQEEAARSRGEVRQAPSQSYGHPQ